MGLVGWVCRACRPVRGLSIAAKPCSSRGVEKGEIIHLEGDGDGNYWADGVADGCVDGFWVVMADGGWWW